jgi:hypothetical protein
MSGLPFGDNKLEPAVHRGAVLGMMAVAAALVLVPILVNRFVPSNDYPFHLARMIILANLDDPIFSRFYQMGSFSLPNLAMDAIVLPASRIFGAELATRAFVAITVLATISGAMFLHWAAHRRFSVWPLLAVALAYNGVFRFGFFNYLFGLAVALHAAALWLAIKPGPKRLAMALLSSLLLMYCHMEAFGVFAVIAGAIELERAFTEWPGKSWGVLRDLLVAATPFLAVIALFLLVSPTASEIGRNIAYAPGFLTKPAGALFAISSGILWLDAVSLLSIASLCLFLVTTGSLAFSRPLGFATVMMGFALLVLPVDIMGATYADSRLAPALALLALITPGLNPRAPRRTVNAVLGTILALAALQSAAMSGEWARYNRGIAAIVDGMKNIEPGATVFAATADSYPTLIADTPERRAAWQPSLKHVASYAVLGAPVFVPMTWAEPTQQPLNVKAGYQQPYKFQGNNPRRVYDAASLPQFIAEITNNIETGSWSGLGAVYILLVDSNKARTEPLPAFVERAAEGERFVLLRLKKPE